MSAFSIGINLNSILDVLAAGTGAVFVFSDNGSNWTEQTYVKATNNGAGDRFKFGRSISLSNDGNSIAAGSYLENSSTSGISSIPDQLANASGAVYLYQVNSDS